MRHAFVLCLCAALGALSCGKAESDSVVYVAVTAPAGMPTVTELRASLSYAGFNHTEVFPEAGPTKPIDFAQPVSFVLVVPRSHSGTIDIILDAFGAGPDPVATGHGSGPIVVGGRSDINIALGIVGTADAGVTDGSSASDAFVGPDVLGLGGNRGSGGVVTGTGGALGQGGMVGVGGIAGTGGAGMGGSEGGTGNCRDNIKNQDETDVDCGGQICAARCGAGKACVVPGDCVAATPAYVCDPATRKCVNPCADKVQDGDETGMDCGGNCPLKCIGDSCKADADCQSDTCDAVAGKCIATTHPLANIKQSCWDGLTGFNPTDRSSAAKYVPCMLANDCCKKPVTGCYEACFTNNDGACGLNKIGGGAGPHIFIATYYQKCVP